MTNNETSLFNDKNIGKEIWADFLTLYKNFSSYNGSETEKTIFFLKKKLGIKIIKYKYGKKIKSWRIPTYRKVIKGILKRNKKNILNYKDNKFFIWQNSVSIKKKLKFNELKSHIYYKKENKKSVPLNNVAYTNTWGLSMSYNQFLKLNKKSLYEIEIVSKKYNSDLQIGELFIKGKSKQEILIDSVISCPSLGNNVSAIAVILSVVKFLLKKNNYFSYRILFTPETIGPLSMLERIKKNKNILGGSCFTNLGYGKYFNYKESRSGNTIFDKSIKYLKKKDKLLKIKLRKFETSTGFSGNEKAYNSLGYKCNMGNFSRSILNTYTEYDTHLDNKDFVSLKNMIQSLNVINRVLEIVDSERRYIYNFDGEPSYSNYGLQDKIQNNNARSIIDYLVTYSDGSKTLLDFALSSKFKLVELKKYAKILKNKNILKEIKVE
mgnify:CR=1 FL=1